MKRVALGVVLLLASLNQCWADAEAITTGNQLQEICQTAVALEQRRDKTPLNYFKTGLCLGYVTAVARLGKAVAPGLEFCTPDNITPGQAVRVLLKFLADHPADTNRSAELLTIAAFHIAWPCK
jgi:Rap1a immunity proteins